MQAIKDWQCRRCCLNPRLERALDLRSACKPFTTLVILRATPQSLHSDSNTCVTMLHRRLLWTGNAGNVVSAHGWKGALNFESACRSLHNVEIDHHEREIYMRVFDNVPGGPSFSEPEALLLVDYDKDDVGGCKED
eukprot:GHUV01041279.1.p1 GENE.GHUV01041279.1~~GHUV01041279.1.p1  ORF type:complete len:136 (-),score=27.00 GHUV01041279.1:555-962(-)